MDDDRTWNDEAKRWDYHPHVEMPPGGVDVREKVPYDYPDRMDPIIAEMDARLDAEIREMGYVKASELDTLRPRIEFAIRRRLSDGEWRAFLEYAP